MKPKGQPQMRGRTRFVRFLARALLLGSLALASSLPGAEKKPPRGAALHAAPQSGKIVGIVTAKTEKEISVKAEGEKEAKRYLLTPPTGGAPRADLQAALKMVFVTNLVVLQWQGEQDPVATGIQAVHSPTRAGIASGTVVAVEPSGNTPSFDVKPTSRGYTERYLPRWDVAAKTWDNSLLRVIAGLQAGDKVKVAWSYDERKRANQIQVTARARRAPSSPSRER
jgi:hypothetical protein